MLRCQSKVVSDEDADAGLQSDVLFRVEPAVPPPVIWAMVAVMLAGAGFVARGSRWREVRQQAAGSPEAAPASDVLPGEWMVPRLTAEVDAAVRQVLSARGMRVAEEDPEAGVVITRIAPVSLNDLPPRPSG